MITVHLIYGTVILALAGIIVKNRFSMKKRNKILETMDMSILEVSISGNEGICFYAKPDRETAARCREGDLMGFSELVPEFQGDLSFTSEGILYILEPGMENCHIRITGTGAMPSGDPFVQGELERD